MADRIGDLGCPGVDLGEWKRNNQIPLYPGKMNTWVLVRTLRDSPDSEALMGSVWAVFNQWFEGDPFDPIFTDLLSDEMGDHIGPTDHI